MSDDISLLDSGMMDLFRLEMGMQTMTLNQNLVALEANPEALSPLEPMMRAVHSIKGAAKIVGVECVVGVAHAMEDCFVAAQQGEIKLGVQQIDVLLQGIDFLQRMSEFSATGSLPTPLPGESEELAASISALLRSVTPSGLMALASIEAEMEPIPLPHIHPNDPEEQETPRLAQAAAPVQSAALPSTSQSAQAEQEVQAAPISKYDESLEITRKPIARAGAADASMLPIAPRDRSVRISAENLNRLMGLAGEALVEANWLQPFADSLLKLRRRQTETCSLVEDLRDNLADLLFDEDVANQLAALQQKANDCYEDMVNRLNELEMYARRSLSLSDRLYRQVIASHMRPFSDGVQSVPRTVRDLARQLGKQATTKISGHHTPVDRDIIDRLETLLVHLLRNALDHGIEEPEERLAAGKPEMGTLRIEASHRAGMLCILVADDGRGIDLERLRQKVVARNLSTEDVVLQLSDSELIQFLFLPGFSTAETVTEISGRGVGLDVVQSMVEELGGSLHTASTSGVGMAVNIQLPLTLSTIRTLLVEIAGEPYAFPLTRIERITQCSSNKIATVEDREYFTLDGQNIGLMSAHQALELDARPPNRTEFPVVIVSDHTSHYGLVVDRFLGERELVVRPLDPRMGKIQNISAAALMEDGSPVLIVDVSDLVRSIDNILAGGRRSKINVIRPIGGAPARKRILVADDSITVREMERKLLENRGYEVEVAVDGMDAWNALNSGHYDLIVTDIDMPRMNGIEFLSRIRHTARMATMPVVIVSYKDNEEDKIKGLENGADYYLTKSSFHDNKLIDAVRDLIGEAAG